MRRKNSENEHGDGWLRRQAIQLAGQLPPEPADARRVLDLMRQLLDDFIVPPGSTGAASADKVKQFKRR